MAGRSGRLLAFFRRVEPRGAPPSAWALAFDAAVAVGAAVTAVLEVAQRSNGVSIRLSGGHIAFVSPVVPGGLVTIPVRGGMGIPGPPPHAALGVLVAAALTALPLAFRRTHPIGTWLVIAAAIVAVHHAYVPPVALGTAVYAAYSAIAHSRYRNLAIAVVAVVTFALAGAFGDQLPRFPGRLTAIFAIVPTAAAGLGIRELRRRLADSADRLRRAADEARAATERALASERARIARELHDVVTHNVSVMVIQAGAARKILASSPPDAEDALLAVESTGRAAMGELRSLLGLLSPAADQAAGGGPADGTVAASTASTAPLHPQPGLGELDALIDRVAAAGLPVDLAVDGEPRPLPPGVDLAAYRVVQEGLTNVLRHAGGATASVAVRWGDELEITVSDDGPGGGTGGGTGGRGPGRGLLGLRERLALYGGELFAGPRPDGGWRVRAVLPAGLTG